MTPAAPFGSRVRILVIAGAALALAMKGSNDGDPPKLPPQDDAFARNVRLKIADVKNEYSDDLFWFFGNDGVMPRPYLVAAQNAVTVDPSIIEQEYATLLGGLEREYFALFGSAPDVMPTDIPRVVYVFADADAYADVYRSTGTNGKRPLGLWNPRDTDGHFTSENDSVFTWRRPDLAERLLCEATRQLNFAVTKVRGGDYDSVTPWFRAGLALYFSGYSQSTVVDAATREFVVMSSFGCFLPDRYSELSTAIALGDALSVRSLCRYGSDRYRRASDAGLASDELREARVVVVEGWAFVKFMVGFDGGKYRTLFANYAKREFEGHGGENAFASQFCLENDADWDDLDTEFDQYVFTDLREQLHPNHAASISNPSSTPAAGH